MRWLQAISAPARHGVSGGPNFAFDLCVRKVTPEQRAGLDLSSWDMAFYGAEPVRAATMAQFAATFAPHGFKPRTLYPCYGLAESTLIVSGGERGEGVRPAQFAVEPLERGEVMIAEPGDDDPRRTRTLNLVRSAAARHRAPRSSTRCAGSRSPPARPARIWLKGASVVNGYWQQPAASAETFANQLADDPTAGPFLRTGDLGFVHGGSLFVSGRVKDLIIVRGRNLHAEDVEATVERTLATVRRGGCAAFGHERDGDEGLVILVELEPEAAPSSDGGGRDFERIARQITACVFEDHRIAPSTVVVVARGSLPRTSSGKLQRYQSRINYARGEFRQLFVHTPAQRARSVHDLDLPLLEDMDVHYEQAQLVMNQLAAQHWIVRNPLGFSVLRYDDVVAVLRDKRWHNAGGLLPQAMGVTDETFLGRQRESLLSVEGEVHARLRRLVAPAFSPRAADRLRPVMREVMTELVDAIAGAGRAEIVADICERYPIAIICELLGAPRSDWQLFARWAADVMRLFGSNIKQDVPIIMRAQDELGDYTRQLIAERRRSPADDLITALIAAEEAGDRMTDDELVIQIGADTIMQYRSLLSPSPARSAADSALGFDAGSGEGAVRAVHAATSRSCFNRVANSEKNSLGRDQPSVAARVSSAMKPGILGADRSFTTSRAKFCLSSLVSVTARPRARTSSACSSLPPASSATDRLW